MAPRFLAAALALALAAAPSTPARAELAPLPAPAMPPALFPALMPVAYSDSSAGVYAEAKAFNVTTGQRLRCVAYGIMETALPPGNASSGTGYVRLVVSARTPRAAKIIRPAPSAPPLRWRAAGSADPVVWATP